MASFQKQLYTYQQQVAEVPCVEFSAMGFGTHASQQSLSTASTASSSKLSGSSNLSGWGSAISRKSYACLKTLGENEARKEQIPSRFAARNTSIPQTGDTWGYFVDTPDC